MTYTNEDPPSREELRAQILGEECTACWLDYAYCLAQRPDRCCGACDHTGEP